MRQGFFPFRYAALKNASAYTLWHCLLWCILLACKQKPQASLENGPLLARVGESELYFKDLSNRNFGETAEDSLLRLAAYVRSWSREQVLLQQAQKNLGDEIQAIEAQLEAYRKALLIFSYQEQMVANHLDTAITKSEIERYYAENNQNFQLRQNIVRYAFIEFPAGHKPPQRVRDWFTSGKESVLLKLEDYCQKRAKGFILRDTNWTSFAEIEKMIPLAYSSQELFLKQNRFVEVKDSLSTFWLRLDAFRIKESKSPLAFETPRIRSILLQERKKAYLNQLEQQLMQDAVQQKIAVQYVEPE